MSFSTSPGPSLTLYPHSVSVNATFASSPCFKLQRLIYLLPHPSCHSPPSPHFPCQSPQPLPALFTCANHLLFFFHSSPPSLFFPQWIIPSPNTCPVSSRHTVFQSILPPSPPIAFFHVSRVPFLNTCNLVGRLCTRMMPAS